MVGRKLATAPGTVVTFRMENSKCWPDVEELAPLYMTSGTRLRRVARQQHGSSSESQMMKCSHDPAIPLLGVLHTPALPSHPRPCKRAESKDLKSYLYSNMHSGAIPSPESTQRTGPWRGSMEHIQVGMDEGWNIIRP